jgi:hypothetical protein
MAAPDFRTTPRTKPDAMQSQAQDRALVPSPGGLARSGLSGQGSSPLRQGNPNNRSAWAQVDLSASGVAFDTPTFLDCSNLFQSHPDSKVFKLDADNHLQFRKSGFYRIDWQVVAEFASWDTTTAKFGWINASGSFGADETVSLEGSFSKQQFQEAVTIANTGGARNVNLPTATLDVVTNSTFGAAGAATTRSNIRYLTDSKFDFVDLTSPTFVTLSGSFLVQARIVSGGGLELFARDTSSEVDWMTIIVKGSSFAGTTSSQKFNYTGMLTVTEI